MIKRGHVLFLLTSVFIVVVAWVGFSIYHSYVTSTISQDLQTAILPISPGFDTTALNKLKSRKSIAPVYQLVPSTAPVQAGSGSTSTESGQLTPQVVPTTGVASPTPLSSTTSASLKGA